MSRNRVLTDEQRARNKRYKQKWWANCSEEKKAAIREQRRQYYWNARHKMGYVKTKKHPQTLCWKCQRAVKECPWSANFEPVPGWEAEPTLISASYDPIHSYLVKKCPLFDPDP